MFLSFWWLSWVWRYGDKRTNASMFPNYLFFVLVYLLGLFLTYKFSGGGKWRILSIFHHSRARGMIHLFEIWIWLKWRWETPVTANVCIQILTCCTEQVGSLCCIREISKDLEVQSSHLVTDYKNNLSIIDWSFLCHILYNIS